MSVPLFVINLDRSADRLAVISESALDWGLTITRVPAVEGRSLSAEQSQILDHRKFGAFNGKAVLPGEIGCYLSHLKALALIANGNYAFGVILEDDVRFTERFSPVVEALGRVEGWDVVKLINHRTKGFVKHFDLGPGLSLGRCLHGPLGGTAAYAVTRTGAKKLLLSMRPMVVPVDVELERAWGHGIGFYTLNRPAVEFAPNQSILLGPLGSYKMTKLPAYRRGRTLVYRATSYVQRVIYALTPSSLSHVARTETKVLEHV